MPSDWVWLSLISENGEIGKKKGFIWPIFFSFSVHVGVHSPLTSTYFRLSPPSAKNISAFAGYVDSLMLRLIFDYGTTETFGRFRLLKTGISLDRGHNLISFEESTALVGSFSFLIKPNSCVQYPVHLALILQLQCSVTHIQQQIFAPPMRYLPQQGLNWCDDLLNLFLV